MVTYIKELLYDHDQVVIPEFGAFVTEPAAAHVHPTHHTFRPRAKEVTFNERLKENDGLLVSTVASREKLKIEEALRRVQEYVYEVKKRLKEDNRCELAGVGTLFINPQYQLEFEADPQVNFSNDSFGLPELHY
ncbi:MAG: SPOR domain-containing protein, partial [Catalinimonas sp.]